MRNSYAPSQRRQHGFTLMELIVVTAIIGILATTAYPSYQRHLESSRRTDGVVALMAASQQLERCYTRSGSYMVCSDIPAASPEGYYGVSLASVSHGAYRLEADPAQGLTDHQNNDTCGVLWINQAGQRGAEQDGCWD